MWGKLKMHITFGFQNLKGWDCLEDWSKSVRIILNGSSWHRWRCKLDTGVSGHGSCENNG